jgi:hypothetical protein
MFTVMAVLISLYANFVGAGWEDNFLPVTLTLVALSAWKRRKEIF